MKYTVHVHTEKGPESFEVESDTRGGLYEKVYKALGERYSGMTIRMPYVVSNPGEVVAFSAPEPDAMELADEIFGIYDEAWHLVNRLEGPSVDREASEIMHKADSEAAALIVAYGKATRANERQKAAEWHNAKTNPPLPGKEVIAWSVIMRDSLIAWVSMLDGKWYEGNFTDEPIAGVEWWTDKPEPPAIMSEPEEATR